MADCLADQIVLERELLSALPEDAGLDQLLDRLQQRGRGNAKHGCEIGEGEPSPQRSRHRRELTRWIRQAGEALLHARAEPVGKPVGDQDRTSGLDSNKPFLPQTLKQLSQKERVAAGLAGHEQQVPVGLGPQHVARYLSHGGFVEWLQYESFRSLACKMLDGAAKLPRAPIRTHRNDPSDRKRGQARW